MLRLLTSVGRRASNMFMDVELVQRLVARYLPDYWIPLKVTGFMTWETMAAVEWFEANCCGIRRPRCLVVPDGSVWQALCGSPQYYGSGWRVFYEHLPSVAWGMKVSIEFKRKVIYIAQDLGVLPDYLMACMAFESGETFSPSVKNAAGSGATGLIQFMPSTAKNLGTTTDALAKMTAVKQLDYVAQYFKPHAGKLTSVEDVYMAILWPAAVGKSNDHVLFEKPATLTGKSAYEQNAGLDSNKDGKVTKQEAAAKVKAKLAKGLLPENSG